MFCIRFSIPGEVDNVWWDNNNTRNYIVKFKLPPPPSPAVAAPTATPPTTPATPAKTMTLLLPQRRRMSGSDRDVSDGGTSSPEPEDLRRRLEGVKAHQEQQQSRQRQRQRSGSSGRDGIFLISRSKARTDLRAKTGWVDEQIEGWRIMLERDVSRRASSVRCSS